MNFTNAVALLKVKYSDKGYNTVVNSPSVLKSPSLDIIKQCMHMFFLLSMHIAN